ncbi:uncharacterized protein LOC117649925 [Thrips palmi]|uniref:Uncharacterized protein LOC117649925 n=1 Tax=Thrips palmi TaxID=161013 RepID=A0A6P8ZV69_THRPL|nr:uncharacterized protein LOC117649925 [Thrips palmi]
MGRYVKCRDSSTAEFTFNDKLERGSIQYFIDVSSCSCKCKCDCEKLILAVIKKLSPIKYFQTLVENIFVPNSFVVEETNDILVVPRKALFSV